MRLQTIEEKPNLEKEIESGAEGHENCEIRTPAIPNSLSSVFVKRNAGRPSCSTSSSFDQCVFWAGVAPDEGAVVGGFDSWAMTEKRSWEARNGEPEF